MADNMTIFNEEIFRPEFPLEGAHLVAASAGTGKTYNIQNIYARLIMEKGWRVSEIQVMTFTEAATKELRDRLRSILIDLQLRLDGKSCQGKDDADTTLRNQRADRLIQATAATPQEQRMRSVMLALLEFDSAAISTIHGFCGRALARFAFETRMTFRPEIEDGKLLDLRRRTLDWWRARDRHTPPELLPELDLETLMGDVFSLSGKTDWVIEEGNGDTAKGFMLAQAAAIVQAYEAERTDRPKQTFDDLLRSMREALEGPFGEEFAARLRGTFRAALIDEFQDTDPVQYGIFEKVFMADRRIPVFLVGDPKQAIYSFRGGDIFTYRAAAQSEALKGRKYYLDTNFRSTPRLMAAVNAIFRDNSARGETFGDPEIDYMNNIHATDKAALQVNGVDDPRPFRFIQVKGAKAVLYQALAQEVVKTLDDYRGLLSPRDIAVLVNSGNTAKSIMKELQKCKVPCVIQKPGNVFLDYGNDSFGKPKNVPPSRMFCNLNDLLKAMAKIGGAKQIRTALLTPFFGWTPDEILGMGEQQLADWVSRFDEMHQAWQKRGLASALSLMQLHSVKDGLGYRERLAAEPDGERLLTDCGQLLELAFAATKEIGPSPAKLVDWLESRVFNGAIEEDAEAYARELESDSDALRIMTMHASKGLQFPVVFLPECNLDVKGRGMCYHDAEHGNRLTFTTGQRERIDAEEEQERRRLLYVAMTRAEQRTVAMYNVNSKTPLRPTLQRLMDNAKKNLEEAGGEPSVEFVEDYQVGDEAPLYRREVVRAVLVPPEKPRRFDPFPTKGSYSAITPSSSREEDELDGRDVDAEDASAVKEEPKEKAPVFQIRGGANIGSCWHEILELLPFDAGDEEIRRLSAEKLDAYGFDPLAPVGRPLPGAAKPASFLEVTGGMIAKTLRHTLTAPDGTRFSLREVAPESRLSELEFNVASSEAVPDTGELAAIIRRHWQDDPDKQPFLKAMENWRKRIPQGFINGFIDLVFQHHGFFYVVDWKSNTLDGTPDSFTQGRVRDEMATHGYFFQYLLYSAVLHRRLKELPDYDWNRHFGGIRYFFLRGIDSGKEEAIFSDRPSEALLDEIGQAFGWR